MAFLIIFIVIVVLGLSVNDGNPKKGLFGALAALLYFPIGVILALTKRYK